MAHFEFSDGSNPYIAFTEKEAKRVIRKYRKKGCSVDEIGCGRYGTTFYLITISEPDRGYDYPLF